MEKQDYINYWVETSESDLASMESVFNAGTYNWSLFIGYLALEKLLKAAWIKTKVIFQHELIICSKFLMKLS